MRKTVTLVLMRILFAEWVCSTAFLFAAWITPAKSKEAKVLAYTMRVWASGILYILKAEEAERAGTADMTELQREWKRKLESNA